MTYITGLFRQLCKMWPDMINSGEIQSTAKAILVFDGEKFELNTEGFNAGHKSYHGGSSWRPPPSL